MHYCVGKGSASGRFLPGPRGPILPCRLEPCSLCTMGLIALAWDVLWERDISFLF